MITFNREKRGLRYVTVRSGRKTSLKTTPPKTGFQALWIRIFHLKIRFQRWLKTVFKTVLKIKNENFTKNGLRRLTGFYRRRRRRRRLTAVRGGSCGFSSSFSWCRALSLSFSLGCRPLSLSFLSFPFLFLFGFPLSFSFLFFSSFSFLSRWLLGQVMKWINFWLITQAKGRQ